MSLLQFYVDYLDELASIDCSMPLNHSTVSSNEKPWSPLSRYLLNRSLSAATSTKTNKTFPKVHLLTSDKCLAQLEEKELCKKLVIKEKERKEKKERRNKTKGRDAKGEEVREENIRKRLKRKWEMLNKKLKKAEEKAEAQAKSQRIAASNSKKSGSKRL